MGELQRRIDARTEANRPIPATTAAPPARPAEPIDPIDPDTAWLVRPRLPRPAPERVGPPLPFRVRLTIALIAASVLPLALFGLFVFATSPGGSGSGRLFGPLLLFAIAIAALFAVLVAYLLAADLTAPLRAIAAAVRRVSAGDLSTPIEIAGDDELARLADSHNRLAADLERRNRELGRILKAVEQTSPRDGVAFIAGRAATEAEAAFGMIDARVHLVDDPAAVPIEYAVPGDPRPLRAELRAGAERLGVLVGHLPATRSWERADQDLLELFAAEIAVAIRSAELFARVEAQNAQLLELDAAKDDFLRGVSHNLQTPLARIRALSEQLDAGRPGDDRRLTVIREQTDRLSRMVRQLLTVTRLESGALRPKSEVIALAARVRRAWEALAADDVPLGIDDRAAGWLAIADADQVDQVLWSLLDNAVKYGGSAPVRAEIAVNEAAARLRLTIIDGGPGVPKEDRSRLFGRFVRGTNQGLEDGSGLGLYVSRELCRAMGGDLVLEPAQPDRGAAFSIHLPAESPVEG